MTYIFDMQIHKVMITGQLPEWQERFPVPGPESKRGVAVVHAWRDGKGPNRAEDMPKVLVIDRPRKTWPDAFKSMNGLHVVRKGVKDVIEKLDPGIHQFFPLKVETKRGVEIEGPWFSMNVHTIQSSILFDQSRIQRIGEEPFLFYSFWGALKTEDIVVDPSRQSGVNLWREDKVPQSLAGSDALVEAFKAKGLRFFSSTKATDSHSVGNPPQKP